MVKLKVALCVSVAAFVLSAQPAFADPVVLSVLLTSAVSAVGSAVASISLGSIVTSLAITAVSPGVLVLD